MTYTTLEAMKLLGVKRTGFHQLRRRYPTAFVVIVQGTTRGKPTEYDKAALDRFIQWRNQY